MSYKALQLKGQRFGRLVALHMEPFPRVHRRKSWMCKCDCGTVISVVASQLKNGHTKSCGCLQMDISRAHGNSLKLWEFRNE